MRKHTITETQAVDQRDLLRALYVWCFWGPSAELDRLMQSYAVEKPLREARKQGHAVTEQTLCDGHIKLTIHMGDEI